MNIASLLVDLDVAVDTDCRQLFMCWHLTRVLGPSLTEMVPPSVVRSVVRHGQRGTTAASCLEEYTESAGHHHPHATAWCMLHEFSLAEAWTIMVNAATVNDGRRCESTGDQPPI